MSYSRARLILGIANVGTLAIMILGSIFLGLGDHLQVRFAHCHPMWGLGTFILGYVAVSFPFDLMGGYILPTVYKKATPSFMFWLSKWCRGMLMHAAFFLISGYLLLMAFQIGGTWAGASFFALTMLLMIGMQLFLAQMLAPLPIARRSKLPTDDHRDINFLYLKSDDRAFTGGISGFGGKEKIIIPQHWHEELSPDLMTILKARRLASITSGCRQRGLLFAFGWNMMSFGLAIYLSPSGTATLGGLVETFLIFSMFNFLGMTGLLQEVSRRGTSEVDTWANAQGLCEFKMQRAISATDKLLTDEPCRPKLLEFLFYPIPSVENRLQSLFLNRRRIGAWNAAHTVLYLSWAGLGLFSRASHYHIGRPELWAFLPSD